MTNKEKAEFLENNKKSFKDLLFDLIIKKCTLFTENKIEFEYGPNYCGEQKNYYGEKNVINFLKEFKDNYKSVIKIINEHFWIDKQPFYLIDNLLDELCEVKEDDTYEPPECCISLYSLLLLFLEDELIKDDEKKIFKKIVHRIIVYKLLEFLPDFSWISDKSRNILLIKNLKNDLKYENKELLEENKISEKEKEIFKFIYNNFEISKEQEVIVEFDRYFFNFIQNQIKNEIIFNGLVTKIKNLPDKRKINVLGKEDEFTFDEFKDYMKNFSLADDKQLSTQAFSHFYYSTEVKDDLYSYQLGSEIQKIKFKNLDNQKFGHESNGGDCSTLWTIHNGVLYLLAVGKHKDPTNPSKLSKRATYEFADKTRISSLVNFNGSSEIGFKNK